MGTIQTAETFELSFDITPHDRSPANTWRSIVHFGKLNWQSTASSILVVSFVNETHRANEPPGYPGYLRSPGRLASWSGHPGRRPTRGRHLHRLLQRSAAVQHWWFLGEQGACTAKHGRLAGRPVVPRGRCDGRQPF